MNCPFNSVTVLTHGSVINYFHSIFPPYLSRYTSTSIFLVRKKRLGSICGEEDMCLDENALCEDGVCRCHRDFYEDRSGVCSKCINIVVTLSVIPLRAEKFSGTLTT